MALLKPDDSIQGAADALRLSIRTLSRRLKEEGANYQLVKDALRRDIAVQQLINTELSITHISVGGWVLNSRRCSFALFVGGREVRWRLPEAGSYFARCLKNRFCHVSRNYLKGSGLNAAIRLPHCVITQANASPSSSSS